MLKRAFALLLVLTLVFAGFAFAQDATPDAAGGTLIPLYAVLAGGDAGDADGSGIAYVTLDPATGDVCYDLTVSGITLPAAAAHIHMGMAGESGDVVIPFDAAPGDDGTASGCVAAEADAIAMVAAHPERHYVNIHTSDFAGGAVRGQLTSALFFVSLAGGEGQDTDGSGFADVLFDLVTGEVCYGLYTVDITLPAAAAHIHRGAAGESGDVVIPFDAAPGDDGTASGCVAVEADVMMEVLANPSGYYVNIHTSDFGAGAIRGQLGYVELAATLAGGDGQDTDGSGSAYVSIYADTVCYVVSVADITLPAAAMHIHEGEAGASGGVVVPFPTAPGDDGLAMGCVVDDTGVTVDILGNPAGYYVNVHTSDFAGGAVRGQLGDAMMMMMDDGM